MLAVGRGRGGLAGGVAGCGHARQAVGDQGPQAAGPGQVDGALIAGAGGGHAGGGIGRFDAAANAENRGQVGHFARSLGDFGVTIMVAGNIPGETQTLSVAIFDAVESGNGRLARILVIVISAAALALLWAAGYLSRPARVQSAG